jgi:hypothetical protein
MVGVSAFREENCVRKQMEMFPEIRRPTAWLKKLQGRPLAMCNAVIDCRKPAMMNVDGVLFCDEHAPELGDDQEYQALKKGCCGVRP